MTHFGIQPSSVSQVFPKSLALLLGIVGAAVAVAVVLDDGALAAEDQGGLGFVTLVLLVGGAYAQAHKFRGEAKEWVTNDTNGLSDALARELMSLGYSVDGETANVRSFRPSIANWVGGPVHIQTQGEQVRIVGPQCWIKKLSEQINLPASVASGNASAERQASGYSSSLPGTAAAAPLTQSLEQRLRRLDDLRSKKLLSDSEYEQKKKDILATL